MLKIRLLRVGRRHRPFYRIVVVDSRRKRSTGKYIALLGFYDPLTENDKRLKINTEAYTEWLKKGAKPSNAVLKLMLPVEEKKKLWPDKEPEQEDKDKESDATPQDASEDK